MGLFLKVLLVFGFCLLDFVYAHSMSLQKLRDKQNAPFSVYHLKGEEEGPTLLVIGGIHGDEPGGYFSPSVLLSSYKIKKGNLYVVPNLNPDSILAFRRGIYKDMNRKFATIKLSDPDYENVWKIKELITYKEVDFIINLHDGHGFYREKWENAIFNPKAWGQTYVIDQKTLDNVPFGNLDEITKKIETKLNQNLHYDFHTFGVRNTQTRFKDEEQQNSLTFFAITNLKPSIAIETSKNIKELDLKVYYQLSSIEALMEILGITFSRDFDFTLEGVRKKLDDFGTLNINQKTLLKLNNIRTQLNFIPLKKEDNSFSFSHPLGRVKQTNKGYEIYIGHQKISTLKPDYFSMRCTLESLEIKADDKDFCNVKLGDSLKFQKGFLIKPTKDIRINVIGYSKKGIISEDNLYIDKIDKNFSLDKQGNSFRIEAYKGDEFCGMIIMEKNDE
ncbi:M99 family carboxypeptidase catalytic domain-containing protein [Helicobacter burdigaliensis]|uniref:M99 family carboxypeptidase catalytic domain-containing protein n=1 Tax=Helicobacter burdigaliensis TaxID=2315334 RepID=UPI000EF70630|nr:M99 family carboxypeptidase catalytic domain-containing protein [Helicobacter burdigaliensis]